MNPSPPRSPRNPWPIVLVTWFVLFISAMVAFVIYASRQNYDLVRHDYYEQELRYQEQLDRLNRTRAVSRQVAVTYDPADQAITIALPPDHARAQASGHIQFYRPANARLDHEIRLQVDAEGHQRLDTRTLPTGHWKIRVTWTVAGQEFFFDQAVEVPPRSS